KSTAMAESSFAPGATVTLRGSLPPKAERTLPAAEQPVTRTARRTSPPATRLRAEEIAVAETRPLPPRPQFIMYVIKLPKSYHIWRVAGMIFPYLCAKVFMRRRRLGGWEEGGEGATALERATGIGFRVNAMA